MAITKKASNASGSARPKATAKRVESQMSSTASEEIHPLWLVPLATLTLKDLIQYGVLDSETSKVDPPHGIRVILSSTDIDKIVFRLSAIALRGSFDWNGKFVLRKTIEDPLSTSHEIYKYADTPDDLTEADNVFDSAPMLAKQAFWAADLVQPHRHWIANLGTAGNFELSIFKMRIVA